MKDIEDILDRLEYLKANPSYIEIRLMRVLEDMKLEEDFIFQYPIHPYFCDFCWEKRKLIIEADGKHHLLQKEYDGRRDGYLIKLGYKILHLTGTLILKNPKKVKRAIHEFVYPQKKVIVKIKKKNNKKKKSEKMLKTIRERRYVQEQMRINKSLGSVKLARKLLGIDKWSY